MSDEQLRGLAKIPTQTRWQLQRFLDSRVRGNDQNEMNRHSPNGQVKPDPGFIDKIVHRLHNDYLPKTIFDLK
jgi:hypothetical protein